MRGTLFVLSFLGTFYVAARPEVFSEWTLWLGIGATIVTGLAWAVHRG